jgi:hypothetical protein
MDRRITRGLSCLPLLPLSLGLSACAGATHANAPDPAGQVGTKSHVIQEPYGFRNVAFSCYGPNGVYVTSRGVGQELSSGVNVVPNDPLCK